MHPLTWLGTALILVGVAFVLPPILGKVIDLSRIPSWLIFIYRSNGFYFVTSPLLIGLSALSVILYFLMK